MKRMHVHVSVEDLDKSIGFYSALFAAQPAVVKPDYAKWMLDHLGIQVESADELQEVYSRLRQAGGAVLEEGHTTCCYAKSEKSWIDDPAGISWETFHTTGESTDYGTSVQRGAQLAHEQACCEAKPVAEETASACCSA